MWPPGRGTGGLPEVKGPPRSHWGHLVEGGPPRSLLLKLLAIIDSFWACCGVEGLLVLLPLLLKPLEARLWLPLLWGASWALGVRVMSNRRARGPLCAACLLGSGAPSPPSYVVGVLLAPLFLEACLPRRPLKPCDLRGASSGLVLTLPPALAVAGVQAALFRFDAPILPQLLGLGGPWLSYPLVGPPSGESLSCWMGVAVSVFNFLLMGLWHKAGRKDFSFSEASTLCQLFTAAALCFAVKGGLLKGAPLDPLEAPLESPFEGDVLLFLSRMFLILLLFCLTSLGALLLPRGPWRASYMRFNAGVFLAATGGYLLLGAPQSEQGPHSRWDLKGPVFWLLHFVMLNASHAKLMLLLLASSAGGLLAAFLLAGRAGPPSGRPPPQPGSSPAGWREELASAWLSSVRKLFHFLLVLNLLVVFFLSSSSLLLLVVSGLLWLLAAAELLRISAVSSVLSQMIEACYARFADSRDARALVLSHIYLVLGVAAPLLVFAAFRGAPGGPPCLLGIILVGCGDSVAALVGTRLATPVLPFTSRKTVGGFLAFELQADAPAFALAVLAAGIFEAYTRDIDNFHLSLLGFVYYQWWAASPASAG
ncbi:hypothetical protein Efla_006959 [Eimeria flavescens]